MFSLLRHLLLYWIHLLPMVRLCAFLEHQSSSLQTRFLLFSSACDPDGSISSWCFARIWISGFGILFRLFSGSSSMWNSWFSRSSTESALVRLLNTVVNVDCPERFNLFLVMGWPTDNDSRKNSTPTLLYSVWHALLVAHKRLCV